jgi:hypothetical protein
MGSSLSHEAGAAESDLRLNQAAKKISRKQQVAIETG